ncbi:unnamed protein product [Linum tenue]|uniref:DDE Tnp4 domain-containing protein n=1 Tax=Linum tenue TaxID=586396 RepID=A0AAV0L829_9ROSI|nr:unnamed protein product [Linum tenue]
MSRLSMMTPTKRRKLIAAISAFWNLIMIYIELGMEVIELSELLIRNPRIARQPVDSYILRQFERQRVFDKCTKLSDTESHRKIRMNRILFKKLCDLLVAEGGLKKTRNTDVDEMVLTFLLAISHDNKIRSLAVDLRRSIETIYRSFHRVLRAILRLNNLLMKKPKPITADSTDKRWKYFKNYLGALDGTHIDVRPLKEEQTKYRDRSDHLTINCLGVCTPNLEFIYCLAGWEGSAHDTRVLRDVLNRPNGLVVPEGCYYLCDSGYGNSPGFLTPIWGPRYHIDVWGGGAAATNCQRVLQLETCSG